MGFVGSSDRQVHGLSLGREVFFFVVASNLLPSRKAQTRLEFNFYPGTTILHGLP